MAGPSLGTTASTPSSMRKESTNTDPNRTFLLVGDGLALILFIADGSGARPTPAAAAAAFDEEESVVVLDLNDEEDDESSAVLQSSLLEIMLMVDVIAVMERFVFLLEQNEQICFCDRN